MKVCSKCKIEKDESEFGKGANKDGLKSSCKICLRLEYKDYIKRNPDNKKLHYQLHKDEYRERSKCYVEKNKDKVKVMKRNWEISNSETIKQKKKIYNLDNKEKISISKKQAYIDNREHYINKAKLWVLENPDRRRKNVREWSRSKRENDTSFKMQSNVRSCFSSFLRYKGIKKTKPFFEYTGIAYADYITYFESNYPVEFAEITEKGKYHIDHIIPCAIYDFNNTEHIKKCWQPENLRIIPAAENLSKNDKLDFDLIDKHNIRHLLPVK
jgi:hypothetical protein